MKNKIDLTKYLKKGSVIFSGRDSGKEVRKKIKLDIIDNDEIKYTIIFPDNLELLSNSFFLGLFGKSYLSLGLQKFNEKYLFYLDNLEYKDSIQTDIDDGISYITTNINSID
ncbi:MAG: hypothetical protein IKC22_02200 [Bacilli bacterium]|nr:hypothetical protein [Bacilli bacterium]